MNIREPSKLPEFLYRYRSINEDNMCRELSSISRSSVYGSIFTNMNDPMEGIYNFYSKCPQTEFTNMVNEILLDKLRKRICAFSEEYDNDLMWAHYAGQSQGICIRYDTNQFERAITTPNVFLERVLYRKRPTQIHQHNQDAVLKILSQKSLKWAGEKEWRLIFDGPWNGQQNAGHSLSIGNALSRVYIGTRVTKSHRRSIISAVRRVNHRASFCEMKIDGYDMHFPPLDPDAV